MSQPTTTFDAKAARTIVDACKQVLADTPEVRAIGIALAYESRFEPADLDRLIWVGRGPNGKVDRPDDAINSLLSTLRLFSAQTDRMMAMVAGLKEQVEVLSTEVLRLQNEKHDSTAQEGQALRQKHGGPEPLAPGEGGPPLGSPPLG